jgi:hypothetical protein
MILIDIVELLPNQLAGCRGLCGPLSREWGPGAWCQILSGVVTRDVPCTSTAARACECSDSGSGMLNNNNVRVGLRCHYRLANAAKHKKLQPRTVVSIVPQSARRGRGTSRWHLFIATRQLLIGNHQRTHEPHTCHDRRGPALRHCLVISPNHCSRLHKFDKNHELGARTSRARFYRAPWSLSGAKRGTRYAGDAKMGIRIQAHCARYARTGTAAKAKLLRHGPILAEKKCLDSVPMQEQTLSTL